MARRKAAQAACLTFDSGEREDLAPGQSIAVDPFVGKLDIALNEHTLVFVVQARNAEEVLHFQVRFRRLMPEGTEIERKVAG